MFEVQYIIINNIMCKEWDSVHGSICVGIYNTYHVIYHPIVCVRCRCIWDLHTCIWSSDFWIQL